MKIFIRTIECVSYAEKEKYRLILNSLGFYCLSRGTDLEVYAIESRTYAEQAVEELLRRLL